MTMLVQGLTEELLRFPFEEDILEVQIVEMRHIWRDFLARIDDNHVQPCSTGTAG